MPLGLSMTTLRSIWSTAMNLSPYRVRHRGLGTVPCSLRIYDTIRFVFVNASHGMFTANCERHARVTRRTCIKGSHARDNGETSSLGGSHLGFSFAQSRSVARRAKRRRASSGREGHGAPGRRAASAAICPATIMIRTESYLSNTDIRVWPTMCMLQPHIRGGSLRIDETGHVARTSFASSETKRRENEWRQR